MNLDAVTILAIIAFIMVILAIVEKVPIWIAVLLLSIITLLQNA